MGWTQIERHDSGTKHTLKIVPSTEVIAMSSVRGKPDRKGTKNGAHFHIKLPRWWWDRDEYDDPGDDD